MQSEDPAERHRGTVAGVRAVGRIHDKFLLKLALRSVLWLAIAFAFVYFFPDATWVWWVAGAFVVLGAVVATWMKLTHLQLGRRAEQAKEGE